MLEWTRFYWGIENGLHFRRDATLNEDAIQMSNVNQAQVTAVLNNFIIALANKMGFSSLASVRRHFDAHIASTLASAH